VIAFDPLEMMVRGVACVGIASLASTSEHVDLTSRVSP
jgi:hypothetical protein